jgi:hypothetical protein
VSISSSSSSCSNFGSDEATGLVRRWVRLWNGTPHSWWDLPECTAFQNKEEWTYCYFASWNISILCFGTRNRRFLLRSFLFIPTIVPI